MLAVQRISASGHCYGPSDLPNPPRAWVWWPTREKEREARLSSGASVLMATVTVPATCLTLHGRGTGDPPSRRSATRA